MLRAPVNNRNRVYIFPVGDFKFKNWASALPAATFKSSQGTYASFLALIFYSIFSGKRVIVFYRYLNVKKCFLQELLKLLLDCIVFFLGILRIIEIRWIMHNVNEETYSRYAMIVSVKRSVLSRVARRVFVTSESLVDQVSINRGSIDVISFGREVNTDEKKIGTNELNRKIRIWKSSLETEPTYVGIVTRWTDKENESLKLINIALKNNNRGTIGIVYLGKKTGIENNSLLEINVRIPYFLKELNVDFVFKTLSDKSLPYTMYSAATAAIPIISSKNSFFSSDLKKYCLGNYAESYNEIISIIENYDKSCGEKYLNDFSWKRGAKALIV